MLAWSYGAFHVRTAWYAFLLSLLILTLIVSPACPHVYQYPGGASPSVGSDCGGVGSRDYLLGYQYAHPLRPCSPRLIDTGNGEDGGASFACLLGRSRSNRICLPLRLRVE